MWYLYIIEKNRKYYTGITTNLHNRLRRHSNPPLLYKQTFPDKLKAAHREREIKGFSREKKEQLIAEARR